MCDTFVALASATQDGSVIFGKNSDRDPNEAHEIISIPAADHPADATVRCTYIEIPQAAHTHAVILAKPFWIWGAEMGGNQFGVVIGNEQEVIERLVVSAASKREQTGGLSERRSIPCNSVAEALRLAYADARDPA